MPSTTLNLPDFIVIGSQKAGTTSLASILGQHPNIRMSSVKEPMFFLSHPSNNSTGRVVDDKVGFFIPENITQYSELFDGPFDGPRDGVLFGEASTAYLANPGQCAMWIRKLCPDVKLIAVVRNPVERLISAYKMYFAQGMESRTFAELIASYAQNAKPDEPRGGQDYIQLGFYARLLAPFYNYFPRGQILVISYEHFQGDPQATLKEVLAFLCLPEQQLDHTVRLNASSFFMGEANLDIDEGALRVLKEIYREDMKNTALLTGLDLSGWFAPRGATESASTS